MVHALNIEYILHCSSPYKDVKLHNLLTELN